MMGAFGDCDCTASSCIRQVELFHSLTDNEVALLQKVVRARRFAKGEFVFYEGERTSALCIVRQGVVKISKLSDAGREHVLRFLFPGDFFGQVALFREGKHYANAQTLEDATICFVDRDALKQLMESNPQMAYRFLVAMSERLHEADEWTGAISLLDANRRIARILLLYYERHKDREGRFDLPVSKRDFASLIGVTPETLSRKLSTWQGRNVVQLFGRKGVRVLSRDGLLRIASGMDES